MSKLKRRIRLMMICLVMLCSIGCMTIKVQTVYNVIIGDGVLSVEQESIIKGSDPSDSLNGNKGSIDVTPL